MRGLINKRGASHFEMILSFTFFVGFVFFVFMVLKPYDTSVMSSVVVDGLYDSFEEKTRTNLSNVFLKANYTGEGDCFYVQLPEDIFIYDITKGNSRVTKLSGVEIDSKLDGANLNIDNGESFFRVAISPEFEGEEIEGCENLDDYELGQPVEREVFSYKALTEMEERYSSDYEGLRGDLRIPPVFDFAVVFEDLPIEMSPQHGVPDLVDVIAQEYVAGVLRSDGNLTNEKFSLRAW